MGSAKPHLNILVTIVCSPPIGSEVFNSNSVFLSMISLLSFSNNSLTSLTISILVSVLQKLGVNHDTNKTSKFTGSMVCVIQRYQITMFNFEH